MSEVPWIRLYGGPELVDGGDVVTFTPIQSCLIALCYIDPAGSVTRERITWLLWGEGEEPRTRHRIRQLLYTINSKGPRAILERNGEAVVPLLRCDASEIAPGDGDPLVRLQAPPTAAFEHWLDGAVSRLSRRRSDFLLDKLDAAAAQMDPEGVRRSAQALIGLGQGGLGAVLDLAWALQMQGKSRRAARVLEEASARPDLVDSKDALRAAIVAVRHAAAPFRPLNRRNTERTPLIGRESLIEAIWRSLISSTSTGLCLYGPPAIGLTRVLLEVGRTLAVRYPRSVVSALGLEHRRPQPFGLFEAWFENSPVTDFLRKRGTIPVPILRAFPRLRSRLGLPKPSGGKGVQAAASLLPEVARLLSDFGNGQPTIAIADDLHRVDAASRELLGQLLVGHPNAIRVVGSVKAISEADARVTVLRLGLGVNLESLEVPELDSRSAGLLVRSVLPDASEQTARKIVGKLGGIPGYLVAAAGQAGRPVDLPKDARQLVADECARLSATELLICSCLAVAGLETSIEAVADAAEEPLMSLLAPIESLIARGILIREKEGIWFKHSFFAAGCYSRLSRGERTTLHRRILESGLTDKDVSSANLERHLLATGEPARRLLPTLAREAKEAEDRGALGEAARLWGQVASNAEPKVASGALLKRLDILIRLRRFGEANQTVSKRASSFPERSRYRLKLRGFRIQALSDPTQVRREDVDELLLGLRSDEYAAEYGRALDIALGVADFQANREWTADLLAAASAVDFETPLAKAWVLLARTRHLYLGNPVIGLKSAKSALREAEEAACADTTSRAINRLIVALVFRGQLGTPEGQKALSKARRLAHDWGDVLLLYDTYVNEGSWMMDVGHLDDAGEAFAKAREIVSANQSQLESLTMRVNTGELLLHQGHARQAYNEFTEALRVAGETGAGRHLCVAGLVLARLEMGQLRAASQWAQSLSQIEPGARFRGNLALIAIAQARVATATGDTGGALDTLLSYARGMLPWMIPAALKLYLESFRLALRSKVRLDEQEVEHVGAVARDLQMPGYGKQILRLIPRLLDRPGP